MLSHAVETILHIQLLIVVHAWDDNFVSMRHSSIAELHGEGKPRTYDRTEARGSAKHTLSFTVSSQCFIMPTFGFGCDKISEGIQGGGKVLRNLHAVEEFLTESSSHVLAETPVEEDASAKSAWRTP